MIQVQVEKYRNLAEDNQKVKDALSAHCDQLEKDLTKTKEKVISTENERKELQTKLLTQVEQRGALLESMMKNKENDLDMHEMMTAKDKLVLSLQERLDQREQENVELQSKLNRSFTTDASFLGNDYVNVIMEKDTMIRQLQEAIRSKDILIQEKDALLSKYQIEGSTGDKRVEELKLQNETLTQELKEKTSNIDELQKENVFVKTVVSFAVSCLTVNCSLHCSISFISSLVHQLIVS